MRLQFDKDDWLHVLMAVRAAQKVYTKGELKTAAWEVRRGKRLEHELMKLVKYDEGRTPQIATKINLSRVGDFEPEAPIVATAGPSTDDGPRLTVEAERRIEELEDRVLELMHAVHDVPEPKPVRDEGLAKDVASLREFINGQNEKLYTHLDALEDRIIAVERRKK